VYHVFKLDWGHSGCDDALRDVLNQEDQNGFYLDRIVPLVYPFVVPGEGIIGDETNEQRCQLIVITGDHVLSK